ncbi:hypothetical protein DICVIV_05849 [Dictyocaulus viviparus]|uniref:ETS domain-containing protein n=1 Tax=Dictyocaulus viviparus TaxID=29172 RepID=A0A0D8XW98_DICVI|nr:hypothetical protein DICVIV_05849 [Dictyocaulus viviparus]
MLPSIHYTELSEVFYEVKDEGNTFVQKLMSVISNDRICNDVQAFDTNYKSGKECCASPLLRYILHLLTNDSRKENLCTWYGGPFGVRIWDTKEFTESYNMAMGTNMNFTNISRALQSCEHITIAGNRLWKRIKQGEYSFFPTYKGHGIPPIPPSAMPRNVPTYFPFERYGIVKAPHSRLKMGCDGIDSASTHHHTEVYYPSFSKQIHHHDFLTNRRSPSSPLVNPTLLAPSHMYSPCNVESSTWSVAPPCFVQIRNILPTPPSSDTSPSASDSLYSNESLLSQSHSSVFTPSHKSYENQYLIQQETADKGTAETIENEQRLVDSFDAAILSEFLVPVDNTPSQTLDSSSSPHESSTFVFDNNLTNHNDNTFNVFGVHQDIFGNISSTDGLSLTIDETSLLYN